MSPTTRDARWNLRVATREDAIVRRGADEAARELSDFVRSAALKEAHRVLADRTVFDLDTEQWDRFMEVLDRPPRVPPGLKELFSRPSILD